MKKSTEKKAEPKPRLPSTLSQAVKVIMKMMTMMMIRMMFLKDNVRVEDLKNLVETSQTRFPDSPLLWLRDVATFLNQKLVTDPVVSVADFDVFGGDPSSSLTANMRYNRFCTSILYTFSELYPIYYQEGDQRDVPEVLGLHEGDVPGDLCRQHSPRAAER